MGRIAVITGLALAAVLAGWGTGAAAPNGHANLPCILCHQEEPRFGVDTRETVTFRDVQGGDDPALCLRCHKPEENIHPILVKPGTGTTSAPKVLPLGTTGPLAGAVVCTTCHFLHASQSDHALLRGYRGSQNPNAFGVAQDLCRDCHGASLEKRSPHQGDEKACVFCHQALPRKGETVKALPRARELCGFCHGGLKEGHYRGVNPFPADPGCDGCHDPHLGKDHPGRLRATYLDAVRTRDDVSPHYRRAFCFACHTPDNRTLLSTDPVVLCDRCHGTGKIPGDPHPLVKPTDRVKVPAGWPLREGALSCFTCHRPGHPEDRAHYKFLRGGPYADRNGICFQCHDREEFARRNPHEDINQLKGCTFCHAVRPIPGKDNSRTVKFLADIVLLCLRCHSDRPHPADVVHTMTLEPARAESIAKDLPLDHAGRITCATCHNPHIAETEEHKLRADGGAMMLCGKCHTF
jgi:hypothetical protein